MFDDDVEESEEERQKTEDFRQLVARHKVWQDYRRYVADCYEGRNDTLPAKAALAIAIKGQRLQPGKPCNWCDDLCGTCAKLAFYNLRTFVEDFIEAIENDEKNKTTSSDRHHQVDAV